MAQEREPSPAKRSAETLISLIDHVEAALPAIQKKYPKFSVAHTECTPTIQYMLLHDNPSVTTLFSFMVECWESIPDVKKASDAINQRYAGQLVKREETFGYFMREAGKTIVQHGSIPPDTYQSTKSLQNAHALANIFRHTIDELDRAPIDDDKTITFPFLGIHLKLLNVDYANKLSLVLSAIWMAFPAPDTL